MADRFESLMLLLGDDVSLRWLITLLHFLWQGAVIGGVAAIAGRFLRGASAGLRYAGYSAALLSLPLCVAVTFCMVDVPASPQPSSTPEVVVEQPVMPPALPPQPASMVAVAPIETVEMPDLPVPGEPVVQDATPMNAVVDDAPESAPHASPAILSRAAPWITAAYAIGVICFLLRLLTALWGGRRLQAQTVPVTDVKLLKLIAKQADRVKLKCVPVVAYCERVAVPTVLGVLRPMILLPVPLMTGLAPDDFAAIIRHELAHIRRYDLWMNLLQRVIESLLFFHPAVWFISRRVNAEREGCCDDLVVSSGCEPMHYAGALLRMAELCATSRRPGGVALAATGDKKPLLERRIERLMNWGNTPRLQLTRAGMAGLLAVLVLLAVVPGVAHTLARAQASGTDSVPGQAQPADADQTPSENPADPPSPPADDDLITIRGNVVDPDGKPAGGAAVYVLRYYWDPTVPKVPLAATTANSDGRFEIRYRKSQFNVDVQRPEMWKEVTILAGAKGFGPGWVERCELPLGEEPTLRLVRDDVPVTGRVVDLKGNPVSGVTITMDSIAKSPDENLDDWLSALRRGEPLWQAANRYLGGYSPPIPREIMGPVQTKPDGSFELRGVGRERWIRVTLEGPTISHTRVGIVTRKMPPLAANDGAPDPVWSSKATVYGADCEIVVQPTRPIVGTIRDAETGDALPGVAVESYRMTEHGMSAERLIRVKSDERGRFRLVGMPKGPGKQIIAVPGDDQPYFMREFDVPSEPGSEPIEMDLKLHRGVWITGRVTDKSSGRPVRAHIHYLPYRTNPFAEALPEFDEHGNVNGYQKRYATNDEGEYRAVGLPGRAILGVESVDRTYPSGAGHEKIAGLDEDGRFDTYNNPGPPGRKWPTAMKEIVVSEDANQVQSDFVLDAGAAVKITAVDPQGRKIGGLDVVGKGNYGSWQSVESATFDAVAFAPGEERTVLLYQPEKRLGKALQVTAADGAPRELTVQLEPCVTIRGRLVDGQGKPITGASIRVRPLPGGDFSPELKPTATDADGRFEHKGVLPGTSYNVLLESVQVGFKMLAEKLAVSPGETIDLGTIDVSGDERPEPTRVKGDGAGEDSPRTPPEAVNPRAKDPGASNRTEQATSETVVAGQVVDSKGKPIAGAQVAVMVRPRGPFISIELANQSKLLGLTKADDDGRFRLNVPKMSSADYFSATVVAAADGFNFGGEMFGPDIERPDVTIALTEEQAIRGQVMDANGEPVVNAEVRVKEIGFGGLASWIRCPNTSSGPPFWPKPMTTDDDGRFTLRGVDRNKTVTVRVDDERFTTTDYWIAPVGKLSKTGTARNRVGVTLSGELTLTLPPPRVCAGKITYGDTPQPVAGARVEIRVDQGYGGPTVGDMTDAFGHFRLNLQPCKTFDITVYPPDGEPYLIFQERIALADGEQPPKIGISLPRGVLVRGKVVEEDSGRPVGGATIQFDEYPRSRYYAPERTLASNHSPISARVATKADGTFAIAAPPGFGLLLVHGPGGDFIRREVAPADFGVNWGNLKRHYVSAFVPLDLKIGREPDPLSITVRRGVTVRGRVVGPDDRPVGEVRMVSRHFLGFNNEGNNFIRVEGGRFELRGLDPEAAVPFYFLDAKNELGTTVEIGGRTADSEPLVVRLQPCGKAVARFIDPEGRPHAKQNPCATFVISPERIVAAGDHKLKVWEDLVPMGNVAHGHERYGLDQLTDDDGRFTFTALIPGATYCFAISGKPLSSDANGFSVKPGETLQLPDIVQRESRTPVPADAGSKKGKPPSDVKQKTSSSSGKTRRATQPRPDAETAETPRPENKTAKTRPASNDAAAEFDPIKGDLLVNREVEKLQGIWALETYTTGGETRSAEEKGTPFYGQRLIVKGSHWVARNHGISLDIPFEDDRWPRMRFAVNPRKSPARIDYWAVNRPEGWRRLGIYRLEGDRLTICCRILVPGGDDVKRPTEFDAKEGSRAGIAVYKRLERR